MLVTQANPQHTGHSLLIAHIYAYAEYQTACTRIQPASMQLEEEIKGSSTGLSYVQKGNQHKKLGYKR